MTDQNFLLIYLAAINILAAFITVYDKMISKLPRGSVRRIPEKTFIQLSAIGGGIGTLLAMLIIRHKTKAHDKLLFTIAVFAAIWIAICLIFIKGM